MTAAHYRLAKAAGQCVGCGSALTDLRRVKCKPCRAKLRSVSNDRDAGWRGLMESIVDQPMIERCRALLPPRVLAALLRLRPEAA